MRRLRGALGALAILAVVVLASPGAGAAPGGDRNGADPGFQGEDAKVKNVDARKGRKEPSARQEQLAAQRGASARWNKLGTPQALVKYDGYLATGLPSDPVAAAQQWISDNRELLGLSAQGVLSLELVSSSPIGDGASVLFRQRFGGLAAGLDGLVAVGAVKGNVAFVSSSLSRDTGRSAQGSTSLEDAFRAAAADLGLSIGAITNVRQEDGWTVMNVAGLDQPQRARIVAVPTPENGVRTAYEVLMLGNEDVVAFQSFVDAQTSEVLARERMVDYLADNPRWRVFPNAPPLDYSSADTRVLWCWTAAPGCERSVGIGASPLPWDVDPVTNASTFTTVGNNARSTEDWLNPSPFNFGPNPATPSPAREYDYPWTNQWFTESCNPDTTFTSPQKNDIDAALANLFAMHNRMHDWSYHLGFTETAFNAQVSNFAKGGLGNDPEHGNAQDGGIAGGPPTFSARDNANQVSPPDGVTPVTNMYLWQPIAGAFYAPCVDGDYDMTVIGHEYTHLISNRMVAGPANRLSGAQANAMGESWSDLVAMEYLNEYGFTPIGGESPYAIGPYVTTDGAAGIRNYNMSDGPLNYSDVGYDVTGPQVHADGEIWSATNFDIREALIGRYGAGDAALQRSCADGAMPVTACPGSRRWVQLVFDAWLLMSNGAVSMLDARDAMLAADVMRFGGANQDLLWNVFASRGLGQNASSNTTNDGDPIPNFESPFADEAVVTFKAVGDADGYPVQLFVGRYEARATPIADTNPATPLSDTFKIVPGTYELIARGNGFGVARFTAELKPGQVRDLPVNMPRNLASSTSGATATGDGTGQAGLIDDTEGTQWTAGGGPVSGRQVTVRFDPGVPAHQVVRVQVSAHLAPGQNRFTALRQFEIWTCEAKGGVDCSQDSQFTLIFTSPADAFPAIAPRPRAPELIYRSFDVPKQKATHVRLRVLTNQCTGAPAYAGEQDADPRANTDCTTASSAAATVRAAELQVFSK